jgi:hypothetical protein
VQVGVRLSERPVLRRTRVLAAGRYDEAVAAGGSSSPHEVLTHRGVAGYALASGLVSPRAVIDGDLTVLDRSSRHSTFLVKVGPEAGYVLKQGADADGHEAVRREAAVYRRLAELGGAAARLATEPVGRPYPPAAARCKVPALTSTECADSRGIRTRSGRGAGFDKAEVVV